MEKFTEAETGREEGNEVDETNGEKKVVFSTEMFVNKSDLTKHFHS